MATIQDIKMQFEILQSMQRSIHNLALELEALQQNLLAKYPESLPSDGDFGSLATDESNLCGKIDTRGHKKISGKGNVLRFLVREVLQVRMKGYLEFIIQGGDQELLLDHWYCGKKKENRVCAYRRLPQYEATGNDAQRWKVVPTGSGFRLSPFSAPSQYLKINVEGQAKLDAEGDIFHWIKQ